VIREEVTQTKDSRNLIRSFYLRDLFAPFQEAYLEYPVGQIRWRVKARMQPTFYRELHEGGCSTELKSLTALLLADLIPAGVYADRLQEEKPDLEPVSDFLRRWESFYNLEAEQ
jgi:hypothetical protein